MPDYRPNYSRVPMSEGAKGLFSKGTVFSAANGGTAAPFREMTIGEKFSPGRHSKLGANSGKQFTNIDRRRMEMPKGIKGYGIKMDRYGNATTRGMFKVTHGLRVQNPKNKLFGKKVIVLKNIKELALVIKIAAHQFPIAYEHWRMALAQRALAVFQESFSIKQFNTAGGKRWKANTRWTVKKRRKKGTWPGAGKLMMETGKLRDSLHIERKNKWTVAVEADASYAGIHNNPSMNDTYGNGFGGIFNPPKKVTQRQFMGHSSKIHEFYMAYANRYLFHTIFRGPA